MKIKLTPIFGSENYQAIGYDDGHGAILVDLDGDAYIFYDLEQGDVEDLQETAVTEGGMALDEEFMSAWGDTNNFASLEGYVVAIPHPDKRIKASLLEWDAGHTLGRMAPHFETDDAGSEMLRSKGGVFLVERAIWILPDKAPDSLLDDMRSGLREENIPPSFAVRQQTGNDRLMIVGELDQFFFAVTESGLFEEPDDEQKPAEEETASAPDIKPSTTVVSIGDPEEEKPEHGERSKATEVILGPEQRKIPDQDKVSADELPGPIQGALSKGYRHGKQGYIPSAEEEAILNAILQVTLALTEATGITVKVCLPTKVGDKQFPPHVVKALLEAGVAVSEYVNQPSHVTAQFEPSRVPTVLEIES